MPIGGRVLVVDDEKVIADTLAMIVQSQGFTAQISYSAEEAIEVAAEFYPQVLISDVGLPRMNGIDLACHFASALPECKVLLNSGNLATGEMLACARAKGYQSFTVLAKPVHPSEILEFLKTCSVA